MICIPNEYYKDWMTDVRDTVYKSVDYSLLKGYGNVIQILNGIQSVFKAVNSVPIDGSKTNFHITNNLDSDITVTYDDTLDVTVTATVESGKTLVVWTDSVTVTSGSNVTTISLSTPTLNGGLSEIDFGTVSYDVTKLSTVFDRFYANWFINQPFDGDFRETLQECYDINKELIDRYWAHVSNLKTTPYSDETRTYGETLETQNKGERTDSNAYGERDTTSDKYDYPVTGASSTSTPSSADKTHTDAITGDTVTYGTEEDTITKAEHVDTTHYEHDDDPIGTVNMVEKLRTFHQMFIDCFKPCFTMFETMTW